jgi:hypothetical protein
MWPSPDSNRDSLAGSKALNALPYFTSTSGISVSRSLSGQILSVTARSCNGILPAHYGSTNFFRRLFLLSYWTNKDSADFSALSTTLLLRYEDIFQLINDLVAT